MAQRPGRQIRTAVRVQVQTSLGTQFMTCATRQTCIGQLQGAFVTHVACAQQQSSAARAINKIPGLHSAVCRFYADAISKDHQQIWPERGDVLCTRVKMTMSVFGQTLHHVAIPPNFVVSGMNCL